MPENLPGSQDQVKTIAVFPLEILMEEIKKEIPDVHIVYDEALTYETAIAKARDDENFGTDDGRGNMPLLGFNRSVIRHADEAGPGARAGRILAKGPKQDDDSALLIYRWVHGTFDLRFAYWTQDAQLLEQFEIAYLGEEGISGISELSVNIPDLGEFKWYIKPEPLEEKTFAVEQNKFKEVRGTLQVRGNYFILRGEGKKILEVATAIKTPAGPGVDEVLLDELTVKAP